MRGVADSPAGTLLRAVGLFVCALVALTWSAGAEARRAALVVGNGAYLNAGGLVNPVRDAQVVADAARRAGFQVTLLTNLTKAGFDQSLREFRQQADGAEVAMVYFAGHGLESGGRNWLLPVDAQLKESRDLRYEAIELDGLLETLIGAQLRMVVLDACRNNPFGNSWRSGTRSNSGGLAETEVEGALVIQAAAGGQVALDGQGENSPFAQSFARRLAEPGLSIHRLGSAVMEDVMTATGGQQRPWTNMSIASREVFLVEAARTVQPVAIPQSQGAATVNPTDQATSDALMWQGADTANTQESYQAYLRMFPGGLFANMARGRIARLQGGPGAAGSGPALVRAAETASASSIPSVTPSPPPEAPVPRAPEPSMATPLPSPEPVPSAAAPALSEQQALAIPVNTSNEPGTVVLAQLGDRVTMPVIPPAPRLPADGYPSCRDDFQAPADPLAKIAAVNRCTSLLDAYFDKVLNGFARDMIAHQDALSKLYSEKVALRWGLSAGSQDRFHKAMLKEHAESKPGGAYYADHAAALARYEKDRAYVADRYCFLTGRCGGYPVPEGIAPPTR